MNKSKCTWHLAYRNVYQLLWHIIYKTYATLFDPRLTSISKQYYLIVSNHKMCYAGDTLDTSTTLTNYLSRTFDLYQKSKRKLVQNDKFFFSSDFTSSLPRPSFFPPTRPRLCCLLMDGKMERDKQKIPFDIAKSPRIPSTQRWSLNFLDPKIT